VVADLEDDAVCEIASDLIVMMEAGNVTNRAARFTGAP
jgi:hypothetical protein